MPVRGADVAQLVEHFTRNEGVSGSNPLVGSPSRVNDALSEMRILGIKGVEDVARVDLGPHRPQHRPAYCARSIRLSTSERLSPLRDRGATQGRTRRIDARTSAQGSQDGIVPELEPPTSTAGSRLKQSRSDANVCRRSYGRVLAPIATAVDLKTRLRQLSQSSLVHSVPRRVGKTSASGDASGQPHSPPRQIVRHRPQESDRTDPACLGLLDRYGIRSPLNQDAPRSNVPTGGHAPPRAGGRHTRARRRGLHLPRALSGQARPASPRRSLVPRRGRGGCDRRPVSELPSTGFLSTYSHRSAQV